MASRPFRIFISYRRDDARGYAGWLEDLLERQYGKGSVFLDAGDIELGSSFPQKIEREIEQADVFLVLMGGRWRGPTDAGTGKARIHGSQDWVRKEVAAALDAPAEVIPILLDGVQMPTSSELPKSLKRLPDQHAHSMSLSTWRGDLEKLFSHLDNVRLQQGTKKLSGAEILDRHKTGKDVPAWIGRVQGLGGAKFRQDVAAGGWREQTYEVRFGGSRPNNNWFSIDDFVRAVASEDSDSSNDPRMLQAP